MDVSSIVAGSNPVSGGIEAAGGLISAITQAASAAEQAKRAQDLREQAKRVQTQQIRPEYQTAVKNAQMQSLYGLPGLTNYQNQINRNISGSIRAIKESSPNGQSTLAAIDSALASGNNSDNDLAAKDAQAQENKAQYANQTLWGLGDKYRNLEDIRDKQKLALQSQAGNLETASTLNKQNAINTGIGGVEQGASQMFKKGTVDDSTTYKPSISTLPALGANQITGGTDSSKGLQFDDQSNVGPVKNNSGTPYSGWYQYSL